MAPSDSRWSSAVTRDELGQRGRQAAPLQQCVCTAAFLLVSKTGPVCGFQFHPESAGYAGGFDGHHRETPANWNPVFVLKPVSPLFPNTRFDALFEDPSDARISKCLHRTSILHGLQEAKSYGCE